MRQALGLSLWGMMWVALGCDFDTEGRKEWRKGRFEEHMQTLSAGQIGCPADYITLGAYSFREQGSSWWVAECNGREYVCSRFFTGLHGKGIAHEISCKPRQD